MYGNRCAGHKEGLSAVRTRDFTPTGSPPPDDLIANTDPMDGGYGGSAMASRQTYAAKPAARAKLGKRTLVARAVTKPATGADAPFAWGGPAVPAPESAADTLEQEEEVAVVAAVETPPDTMVEEATVGDELRRSPKRQAVVETLPTALPAAGLVIKPAAVERAVAAPPFAAEEEEPGHVVTASRPLRALIDPSTMPAAAGCASARPTATAAVAPCAPPLVAPFDTSSGESQAAGATAVRSTKTVKAVVSATERPAAGVATIKALAAPAGLPVAPAERAPPVLAPFASFHDVDEAVDAQPVARRVMAAEVMGAAGCPSVKPAGAPTVHDAGTAAPALGAYSAPTPPFATAPPTPVAARRVGGGSNAPAPSRTARPAAGMSSTLAARPAAPDSVTAAPTGTAVGGGGGSEEGWQRMERQAQELLRLAEMARSQQAAPQAAPQVAPSLALAPPAAAATPAAADAAAALPEPTASQAAAARSVLLELVTPWETAINALSGGRAINERSILRALSSRGISAHAANPIAPALAAALHGGANLGDAMLALAALRDDTPASSPPAKPSPNDVPAAAGAGASLAISPAAGASLGFPQAPPTSSGGAGSVALRMLIADGWSAVIRAAESIVNTYPPMAPPAAMAFAASMGVACAGANASDSDSDSDSDDDDGDEATSSRRPMPNAMPKEAAATTHASTAAIAHAPARPPMPPAAAGAGAENQAPQTTQPGATGGTRPKPLVWIADGTEATESEASVKEAAAEAARAREAAAAAKRLKPKPVAWVV